LAGWASAALGFLAKGPAGLAYPLSAIALYLAASRRWRDLGRLFSPAGIAVFLALAVPWFAAVILRESRSLDVFLSEVGAATAGGGHRKGLLYGLAYYSVHVWGEFAPWSPLLIPAAIGLARGRWREGRSPLVLAWAAGILGILHAIGQKQPHYLLPALPPLALLVAAWIDGGEPWTKRVPPAWRASGARTAALLAAGVSLAWACGLFGAEDNRVRAFAAEARELVGAAEGTPIYAAGDERPALSFHIRRVVRPLDDPAALNALLARGETFFAILRAPGVGAPATWDPPSDPRFRLLLEAPKGPRALRLYRAEPRAAR
ncbi:MAG: ArnT family glycosyltransferase, partial [Planctomycetota bacterium]